MNLFINIISIAGPLIFAAGIFMLKNISSEMKIVLWVICALILIFDLYLIVKDKKNQEEKTKREELYNRLNQRQELFDRNLPGTLTEVLERNPLLKKSFLSGQKYEKEFKFEEAIKVYEKCLYDLSIPEEDKIGFNILVGNCYYFLSKLNQAEKYFKESLNILKRAENKITQLPAKSAALGNIGNIYHNLGKPDEALAYYQQALEINQKLGYEQGAAHNLNNIGTLYNELGKQDEALRCQEEALEISKKFKDEPAIANSLTNMGIVYTDSGKPEEALKLFQEALEIYEKNKFQEGIANVFNNIGLAHSNLKETDQALDHYQKSLKINKKIGYKEGIATNLGNIGLIYITLGKPEEALKYYQEALEVFMHMNAQARIEILLKLIKIIEQEKEEKR
ncbi:MAG TPA: tetratricopeptide repeat protein [Candidatus Atribacteria bacterium]|nr:tetratricopeptide repeat protein [Candidatus Atribacteria bacterium]